MLGEQVSMNQALVVTLFSMGIVFIALLAISFILDIFKVTLGKENKSKKEEQIEPIQEEIQQENKEDEEEIVAVITAALAANLGKRADELIVKNIKRLPDLEPAWIKAGRLEQMR